MNETIKNLLTRRSVRAYLPKQVEESLLQQVLEAGTYAPTGGGRQTPVIVAVQNPETVQQLSRMNAAVNGAKSDPFYGAPTVLVVLAEADNINAVKDGSLVLGNLMNAASALGIGSCWVNRAQEVFASAEGKALLEKCGVQGDYIGVGNCILGYPAETPAAKPIKENRLYYVR